MKPVITIFDTAYQKGASVDDRAHEDLPVVHIRVADLVGLEPDVKMESPESAALADEMAAAIGGSGEDLPPILVRQQGSGYQVIDGHHRLHVYRRLGRETIRAKVVPEDRIVVVTKDSLWQHLLRVIRRLDRFVSRILGT